MNSWDFLAILYQNISGMYSNGITILGKSNEHPENMLLFFLTFFFRFSYSCFQEISSFFSPSTEIAESVHKSKADKQHHLCIGESLILGSGK